MVAAVSPSPNVGTVRLVGAGPGGADLLTLRAARLLGEADVVLYDALVDPQVLAFASRARCVPVGKRAGGHATDQRLICRLMVREARRGLSVVRLKGGDPMLFGRAFEEVEALAAAGIPFEVVPGVTSACAAAAEAAAPLTRRGVARSVAFVTPAIGADEEPDNAWIRAAQAADSVVIYMASRHARDVCRTLLAAGRNAATPVLLCVNAGRAGGKRFSADLADAARGGLDGLASGAPALLLVGEAFSGACRGLRSEQSDAHAARFREATG